MNLRDYQLSIATTLDADPDLKKGGCKAMAEDSLAIGAALKQQLQSLKGVALVVMTPSANKIGAAVPGWIPVELPDLTISCIEMPAVNRGRAGAMTALEAAQRVVALLDSPKCSFKSIQQSADETTGALSANAIFSTTTFIPTTTQQ